MTDKTTLLALSDRVESAVGPAFALDREIMDTLSWPVLSSFTGSLDGALLLVSDGHDWTVYHTPPSPMHPHGSSAGVRPMDDCVRTADASDTLAATPALALAAAALRARAALTETSNEQA